MEKIPNPTNIYGTSLSFDMTTDRGGTSDYDYFIFIKLYNYLAQSHENPLVSMMTSHIIELKTLAMFLNSKKKVH